MFKVIWDKLKIILDWITDFQTVYNYEVKQSTIWFPYATISPANSNEEIYDSTKDIVNVIYSIKIFTQNKSVSVQEDNIRKLVDDVLQELREDFTLSWSSVNVKISVNWWYSDDEQPMRIADINVNYLVLKPYQ